MADPVVEVTTNHGSFTITLDPVHAPKSVENFLSYADARHYDGTVFHRVIPTFMVQGGGFDQQLDKRLTRAPIQNEADNGLRNTRGTVAMARTGEPHSATAQFFVNVTDNAFLDHKSKDDQGGFGVGLVATAGCGFGGTGLGSGIGSDLPHATARSPAIIQRMTDPRSALGARQ